MYQRVNSKDFSNPLKAQIRDKVHLKKYASHILSFSTCPKLIMSRDRCQRFLVTNLEAVCLAEAISY